MRHGAFHATREQDQYGIGILSRLPVVEQSLLKFRKWRFRNGRACLFVKVAVAAAPSGADDKARSRATERFLWFATAHLQNDLTGLENGRQLEQIVAHLPKLETSADALGAPRCCVIGMDSNLPAFRIGPMTQRLGICDATLSLQSTLDSVAARLAV